MLCIEVRYVMRKEILKFERIRNLRIDHDYTQKQIAEYLNIKQNTYSQYEIGILNYPIDILIKLSIFYQTSIDYLLGLTDNPVPYERKKNISL